MYDQTHKNDNKSTNTVLLRSASQKESLFSCRNLTELLSPSDNRSHENNENYCSINHDNSSFGLFSHHSRTFSNDSSDGSLKLGKLSYEPLKLRRRGIDELLSSLDGDKHDYDWLLTPPGSPVFPVLDRGASPPRLAAPTKSTNLVRSASTTKASRLSLSQSESNQSSRPRRSSSASRLSHHSTLSASRSVSSFTRSPSPVTRATTTERHAGPSARLKSLSRTSTSSKSRPTASTSSIEKTRSPQNSRPSSPSIKPHSYVNLSSLAAQFASHASTPSRKGRVQSNGSHSAPSSRTSSPASRQQLSQQPAIPPDISFDTPPNLRTSLPGRALSAGRSRPGATLTVKGNAGTLGPLNRPRRSPSPISRKGKHNSKHTLDVPEPQKAAHASEMPVRKPAKHLTTATEGTGFGRSFSRRALDMAIRHMDLRSITGISRPLSSTTLFPQSIRAVSAMSHSVQATSTLASVSLNVPAGNDDLKLDNIIDAERPSGNEVVTKNEQPAANLSEADNHGSSRYEDIILKEDVKNTSWLHGVDDEADEKPIFDDEFEPLPEPFDPL